MRLIAFRRAALTPRRVGMAVALAFGFALLAAGPAQADLTPTTCPDVQCVANDLDIQVTAQAVAPDPVCSFIGDTVTVLITHTINTQGEGGTRYDLGVYAETDPGDTNDCTVDILLAGNSTGAQNQGEMDKCLDVADGMEVVHSAVFTVPCLDNEAPFGMVDPFPIWESWSNQDNQVISCTELNVREGTDSKCRSATVDPDIPIDGVPTTGEWGMLFLSLLLLGSGALILHRRRTIHV